MEQKIIYSEIVQEPKFYFDKNEHFYVEATAFIMTGDNIEFLIKYLNSKTCMYLFKKFYAGGGLGEKGYRYKKEFLELLPIPQNNSSSILNIKDEKVLENEICEIYNLNSKEKNHIMNAYNLP